MVLVKKGPFFRLFILGNIGKKNEFHDIGKRKIPFLGYKKKVQKVKKLRFFQKGLVHSFGPKMASLTSFYFGPYRPGK